MFDVKVKDRAFSDLHVICIIWNHFFISILLNMLSFYTSLSRKTLSLSLPYSSLPTLCTRTTRGLETSAKTVRFTEKLANGPSLSDFISDSQEHTLEDANGIKKTGGNGKNASSEQSGKKK